MNNSNLVIDLGDVDVVSWICYNCDRGCMMQMVMTCEEIDNGYCPGGCVDPLAEGAGIATWLEL